MTNIIDNLSDNTINSNMGNQSYTDDNVTQIDTLDSTTSFDIHIFDEVEELPEPELITPPTTDENNIL